MSSDSTSIWVTRVVESAFAVVGERPFAASFATFGWPPVVLSLVFFVFRDGSLSLTFQVAHWLAVVTLVLGPYLIWRYDRVVLPSFRKQAEHLTDTEALDAIVTRYHDRFAHGYLPMVGVWLLVLVGVLATNPGFLLAQGVTVDEPTFWLYVGLYLWGGVVTGIGFHGITITVRCIRSIALDCDLDVDPLHPDGLGGLGAIGYFAIRTTLFTSLGTLLLPFALQVAAYGSLSWSVYVAIAFYTVFVALSFVYPTATVYVKAQQPRRDRMEALRERIASLRADLADVDVADEPVDAGVLALQLEIRRLREELASYRATSFYPVSPSILTRLVSLVLLPLVFTVLELYLSRTL